MCARKKCTVVQILENATKIKLNVGLQTNFTNKCLHPLATIFNTPLGYVRMWAGPISNGAFIDSKSLSMETYEEENIHIQCTNGGLCYLYIGSKK